MEMENNALLLTIAIPTYNRKELLKRALESIMPQLNPEIEVLVSDNASNDGTDEMMAESFPMIRYIKNETNKGADYNFLQCYREAKGKYVMLLGSDDRFSAGALAYLTDFLGKNDCDLVLMNYRFYDVTKKEVYIRDGEHIKDYKTKQDIVTKDRNLFIEYASDGITFMSASIVKRALVAEIKEPERFVGTYFLHTYIMLEAVKGRQALFGVIMQPLMEQNTTEGDDEMSKKPDKYFTVWGKEMHAVLCDHAVKCGFDKRQMEKIFIQPAKENWPATIIKLKAEDNDGFKQQFWKYGYPVIKKYPSLWLKIMPYYCTPVCVAKFYRMKLRPLIKGKSR